MADTPREMINQALDGARANFNGFVNTEIEDKIGQKLSKPQRDQLFGAVITNILVADTIKTELQHIAESNHVYEYVDNLTPKSPE